MRHPFHKILIVFLYLLPWAEAFAAVPPVRNFSREITGGGAQNWGIAQDAAGVMFFANNGGLLEFDSRTWTIHRSENASSVRSVLFDAAGSTVYYGASDELGLLRQEGNRLSQRAIPEASGISASEIWDIHTFGEEILYRDAGYIYRLSPHGTVIRVNAGGRINCSAKIGGSILAAIQGKGVFSYDGANFAPLPGTDVLRDFNIRAIVEAGREVILVTESDGLFRYADLSVSPAPLLGKDCPQDIFCAAAGEEYFAVGTISEGIFIRNLKTGEVLHLDSGSGLQKNTVLSLAFDRDGNLWAGLDNGIDCICLNAPDWRIFGPGDNYGTGYASTTFGGRHYFGTNQGLFRSEGNEIRPFAGIRWQVWSLDKIDGCLFCSHDKGLDVFYPDGSSDRIPLNGCWKTEQLLRHPGSILGCTYDGLFILEKIAGRWLAPTSLDGFNLASKAFEEDYDGRVWLSHHIRGLYRLKLSDDLTRIESVEEFSTSEGFPTGRNNYPNEYGDALVFSTEGGYFRFDNISGRARPIDELNRLFTSVPTAAKVVRLTDSLEFFSSGAIQTLHYRTRDGDWVTDSLSVRHLAGKRPLGFEWTEYIPGEGLLVNTEDGFSLISLQRLAQRSSVAEPDVFIHSVRMRTEDRDSVLYASHRKTAGETITVPYKTSSLTFSYICPNYRSDGAIRYACCLEGFEKGWTQTGTANSKEYTRLPDGDYIFRVRAIDTGTGKTSETAIRVRVKTPWYKTPFAILLYLLLTAGGIVALVRMIAVLSNRRAEAITREKEEALKLAATTSNLIRKNEILTAIDADLENLKEYVSPGEGRSALRKIRADIRENITHDDDWDAFQTHFDVAYNNFLSRLGKRFPSLTTADKRLCAYLKMGLSSKEIAPLMNLTYRSVEMTRYRLRKKLALPREENLVKFLQDF